MRSKIRECFLTFAAIMTTFLGGGMASAAEAPIKLSDNPNSPRSITIVREVAGVKNKVNNVFGYSLEPVESVNPAGVDNVINKFVISFNNIMPEDGTARRSTTLDLGSFTFSEVGDYKFVLREVSSSNSVVYPVDSENEYYITVSVRNELRDGAPTGHLVPTLALQVLNHDQGEKTDAVFVSDAQLTYVQITKKVEGNLARRDEYFKFNISFPNAADGDVYTVVGQDEVVDYHGETINTQSTVVVGQRNVIYLKHGQVVRIGTNGESTVEIPIGTEFQIEEEQSNNYVSWLDGAQVNSGQYTLAEYAFDINPDNSLNRADYVNVKEASVLTGITMYVWPLAIIAAVSIGSAIVVRRAMSAKK